MKQFESVDLGLLRKYSAPGPRYTSYPTAPAFSPAFGPREYRQAIEESNPADSETPISLYFHFPFCDTLCYFCGCTMLITHSRDQISEYNGYLLREIDMVAPLISKKRKAIQLHWGGGTPSYLSPDEIREVGTRIRERFNFDNDIEAGVEIDPRGLTFDHMKALRDVGFNRISMGVQDFDIHVQEA
ncbi:MAG TPA: radical SAM protein, partial [Bacteroidota bacterium]|nr:radical SAM protein [Bacteroidota bacterium]